MSCHVGTVQMTEELESGIRKWEEMWFKTTAEDGERGSSNDPQPTLPPTSHPQCASFSSETLALNKSLTYLLTHLITYLTYKAMNQKAQGG